MTSDQKRTEKILERTRMALSQRNCRLKHRAADKATETVVWQCRQNRDGIDGGGNYLDTRTHRRSEIYRSVSLVEGSLGQVRPG